MTHPSRVVLVVGATGGIGEAIAAQFAAAGDRVVVHYHRSRAVAEALANRLPSGDGEPLVIRADLSDFVQVQAMVTETVRRWGRVDVLVNAAGKMPEAGRRYPIEQYPEASLWHEWIDVELKGTFRCLKAVAPQMIAQQSGHIVLLNAGSAFLGLAHLSGGAAAKAGQLALARVAALELGQHGIQINTVCPGPTAHRRNPHLVASDLSRNGEWDQTWLDRLTTPAEVAEFILALTRRPGITGQIYLLQSQLTWT